MLKKAMFIAAMTATVSNADTLQLEVVPTNYQPPKVLIELDERQMFCLAQSIYFEARTETFDGMVAVAHTMVNRVKSDRFPDTMCKVVRQGIKDDNGNMKRHQCQFSWYCDGKPDQVPVDDTAPEQWAWEEAQAVADIVANGYTEDITNGSTHYHAHYVDPAWNQVYELVAVVDQHLFYKK